MKRTIDNWFSEKILFFTILLFSICMLVPMKFYPSMDGPCHLYNSNIVASIIKGETSVISDYFIINKALIPNWISYLILSILNLFMPGWLAEKILLIFYLFGISVSFRLLIKQLCPENPILSILIIPFAYSFLFHLGFYNYCLSFVFLFFTMYYWLRSYGKKSLSRYLILFLLMVLTYFSALITFFFLVFCLGLFTVVLSVRNYRNNHYSFIIKNVVKELSILALVSLPCLVFSIIFIKSNSFYPSNEHYSTGELLKWLNDVRCLIVYDYAGEEKFTGQFLHIAIAVLSISLFIRFRKMRHLNCKTAFRTGDIILIPILLSLFLFFIVPDGSNAGMMSDRFCLLVYMFIIIWISSQPLPKGISIFIVILIITLHIGLLFKRQNGVLRGLNKDAVAIYNASKYLLENSIVLPVNMSDNWIEPHFSNYLGVDKPLVILENYAASTGWFPVKWNAQMIPQLKTGGYDKITGVHWVSNTKSANTKQIDYVFLYGNIKKIDETKWSDLKTVLEEYYKIVFYSEDNYLAIYKNKETGG